MIPSQNPYELISHSKKSHLELNDSRRHLNSRIPQYRRAQHERFITSRRAQQHERFQAASSSPHTNDLQAVSCAIATNDSSALQRFLRASNDSKDPRIQPSAITTTTTTTLSQAIPSYKIS